MNPYSDVPESYWELIEMVDAWKRLYVMYWGKQRPPREAIAKHNKGLIELHKLASEQLEVVCHGSVG